jgi:hypothetical protein
MRYFCEMNVTERIDLLERLGNYILADTEAWQVAKRKAERDNAWFIAPFIQKASETIAKTYLRRDQLTALVSRYEADKKPGNPKTIGLVMAGNIPLVGFHDFLCVFLSGHNLVMKPSSKDDVLIRHLVEQLTLWDSRAGEHLTFAPLLKGADAFIATGSNNTSRYFDYYFKNYPHIIRRNKTSAGILSGGETQQELENLADDVHLYFGLGCRNITKLYVPQQYNFEPLLKAFNKYNFLIDYTKYKNNYDYQLAVCLLNKQYYMTNGSLLLTENKSLFSPISVVHYAYYDDIREVEMELSRSGELQAVAGKEHLPFGRAQNPSIFDFADRTDTMRFLVSL